MSNIRQIIINTLTGWLSVFARALIALVLVPFLITHLGKEGFGLVGLLSVILSMTQIADMGLRQALGRHMAEGVAKQDEREISELASTALMIYILVALLFALFYCAAAPWLVSVFKVSASLTHDAIISVRLYGSLSVLLAFVTPVFSAGLTGHNRFDLVNYVQVASGIISGILMFAILPFVPKPLYGWIAVMLLVQTTSLAFMMILFFRLCSSVRLALDCISWSRLRSLFSLGSNLYLMQLARSLAEQSDPLVISCFFGPTGVSLYNPGGKLANMLRPIVMTLGNQLYPLTTKHYIDGRSDNLERMLLVGTRYTVLLGALASVVTFVFAEPFCRLWLSGSLGSDYLTAARVMQAWSLATFFMYIGGTQWSIGLGMNKLRFYAWILLPSAVLNIALSIYIVGYTRLGIPGVVVATIITEFFRRIIIFCYCTKILNIPLWRSAVSAYARPLVVSLALSFIALLILRLFPVDSWGGLLLAVTAVTLIWAAFVFIVGSTLQERKMFFSAVGFRKRKKS